MPQMQPQLLEISVVGETAVVRFTQQSLADLNPQLAGEQLLELVDRVGQHWVFFDFENVDYLASIGLGKLVALHKRIEARGGRLTVLNVRESVYQVFEVTRLVNVLDVRRKDGDEGAEMEVPA